jgi:hypothetical protein
MDAAELARRMPLEAVDDIPAEPAAPTEWR